MLANGQFDHRPAGQPLCPGLAIKVPAVAAFGQDLLDAVREFFMAAEAVKRGGLSTGCGAFGRASGGTRGWGFHTPHPTWGYLCKKEEWVMGRVSLAR